MISAPTINIKGTDAEKTVLPKDVFEKKVKPVILAQAVRVWLSNQRAANAKTKTRTEVSKTTAKMYKQKGTGRARHGSYAAPIFVGGGVAHGPTGEQNYTSKMPKKMKKLAIESAFSDRAKDKKVVIVHTDKMEGKTKEGKGILTAAKVNGSVLVVVANGQNLIKRSFRNLEKVSVVTPGEINAYTLLKNKWLLITKEALTEITKLWGKG